MDRSEIGAGEEPWLVWLPLLTIVPGLCVAGLCLLALRLRHGCGQIEAAARAANEDRMRLLATMSHELRTPLTGILGQAELLGDEGELNDRQLARLTRLTEAGTLMRAIVDRVTNIARPENRDLPPVATRCDVDQLVRACAGMVETEARKKGLHLTTFVDPSTPARPWLIRDLVQQVLVNLLMNGVKYTARGTVALRVMSHSGGFRFEVADTGPGIPASKRRRLFREYDRLDAKDSRTAGTGLGLSITERFVKSMGGRIGHADNPGGGSLFWVELPQSAPNTGASHCQTSEPPSEGLFEDRHPAPDIRALDILLADDLDLTRCVTADFLRSAGHAVTEVSNGEAAIEAVRGHDFDVLLTDMRMPLMDGLEATRRIRALPGHRGDIPVVLVTADLVALAQGSSGQTGVDHCLRKPFTRAELLDIVETAARLIPNPHAGAKENHVLDLVVFNEMKARLGATFASHIQSVTGRIGDLVTMLEHPSAAEDPAIASAAHDLIGLCGILGLAELSLSLQRFAIAKSRVAPTAALRKAASEAVRVLQA